MSAGKDYVPQLKTLIDKHDVETFERLYKNVIHELDIYEQNELLFRTCRLGPVEIFQILFKMQEIKDLNNVLHPTTKSTLLHYAIKYEQHKIIDYLLSSNSSCYNVKNVFGETCLSVAIALQNLDVVRHLLHHISAEAIDKDLTTHAICHCINEIRITATLSAHKAFEIVQVLVAHASNNLSDQVISKAVHELVKRLSWLYSIILSDNQWLYLNEIIRYFVEKLKCSLSHKDKNNCTTLMLACRTSSVSLVEYLFEKGLHYSVNDQDSNGETCLFYAVERNNNMDMIDLLIDKYEALVELRNGKNLTALHKAIRLNSFQNVKHLLTKLDDVQKYFSYACQYSSVDITQLFLQHQHQLQTIEKEKALDCALKNENKNDSLRILGVLTNSATNLEKCSYGVHELKRVQTQVGIIGAGPAGLMLAHLLLLNGIDSIIIERNIQSNLEGRIRACVFEQDTLDLLDRIHFKSINGRRLHLEGLMYHGIRMQFNGKRFRLPLSKLTNGKAVTVYGQHLLIEDLITDLKLKGVQMYFQVKNVEIERLDSERPMIRFHHSETDYEMHCDFVAGCDGFYGVSRASIPREILTEYERKYPFGWLCVSVAVEPSCEELIYSYHQHGFALYNKRSNELSRFYLQVSTGDSIEDWSDERIWEQLHLRLNMTDPHWTIKQGQILDKTIFSVRTFMVEPMQYKQLFLVGDVAHIMPPTGAKGMNMAIADAKVLSDALSEWYMTDSNDQIQSYSEKCLHRVWLAQEFAMSMSELLHRNFDLESKNDGFDQQMIHARQRHLAQSEHVQRAFAHMYTGTPF